MTVGPVTVHVEYDMQLVERKETNKNEKTSRGAAERQTSGEETFYTYSLIEYNYIFFI